MANKQKQKKPTFNFYWIYAVIAVILISLTFIQSDGGIRGTTQQEFQEVMLKGNDVERVDLVDRSIAHVTIKKESLEKEFYKNKFKSRKPLIGGGGNNGPHFKFQVLNSENFSKKLSEWGEDSSYGIKYDAYETNKIGQEIFSWLIFFGIMLAIWMFIMRRVSGGGMGGGSQIFNVGKSKAKIFGLQGESTNTTFKDVAGLEGAKEEIKEIVDFLKNPKKYTELGAKIPKGALLVGPPGTGKTLLAKAVAGEAKVPFFSLSGSDFVEMFVGVGASRVRDLFKQAKEKSPSIIFIDEIDAIGRARGKNPNMGSNDERENTLNQLLTEMDGFGTNSGVIILAATNRVDVLDSALLRAGRFDRQIFADMPDLNERRAIFDVHLKPLKIAVDLDRDFLSRQTPGFSGADIANLCNEAALIAARKKKKVIEKQEFLDAVDRIIGGLEKKNKIITPGEKRAIAIHEAGHATVSWMCEHANPLVKVTIVPRGRSLGAAWYLPEERQITTTEQILDEMCAALGGRAAEFVEFGKISTGALSDLEKVTKQAHAMVSIYGLNDKVGNVSYYNMGDGFTKPFSEKTAALMDEEVKKITDIQYQRAIDILTENKDKLNLLADKLIEKEVIFKEDLELIFGKRPFDKEEVVFEEKTEKAQVVSDEVINEVKAEDKKTELDSSSDKTES